MHHTLVRSQAGILAVVPLKSWIPRAIWQIILLNLRPQ